MNTRRRGRPPALTKEAVASAVLDVGFIDLTFSAVRERLGVGESTLYRYAPDRDALVCLAMDYALEETSWPTRQGPWRDVLSEQALTVWHLLAAHPGAATEAAQGIVPPRMMRLFAELATFLVEAGFTPDTAVLACDLVLDLVSDHRQGVERRVTVEPPKEAVPADVQRALAAAVTSDPLTWFESKLRVVLDGIEHSLAPTSFLSNP